MNKKIIVVLGMHRSGTSAFAKAIVDLGAYPGDNLIPGDEENEKGYWEDANIVAINNKILDRLNMKWYSIDNPLLNRFVKFLPLYEEQYLQDAVEIVRNQLSSSDAIIIKDPRISLLLPFWEKVFGIVGIEAQYVLAVRNPLETAKSLLKRNKMQIDQGIKLWTYYNFMSLLNMNKDILLCSFSSLLDEPEKELEHINRYIKLNNEENDIREYRDRFLEKSLKHHNEDFQNLTKLLGEDHFSVTLYQTLSRWSQLDVVYADQIQDFVIRTVESCADMLNFVTKQYFDDYVQVFYDSGNGFSEEQSTKLEINLYHNDICVEVDQTVKQLRFDPSRYKCMVEIKRMVMENHGQQIYLDYSHLKGNDYKRYNGFYIFDHNDPQIWIQIEDMNATKVCIDFVIYPFDDYTQFLLRSLDKVEHESRLAIVKQQLEKEKEEVRSQNLELHNVNGELTKIKTRLEKETAQLVQMLSDTQEQFNAHIQEKRKLDLLISEKLMENEQFREMFEEQQRLFNRKEDEIGQLMKEKEWFMKEKERLEILITERNEYITTIFNTISWRVTKPLRFVTWMMNNTKRKIRKIAKKIAKSVYYRAPLPRKFKIGLKNQFYKNMKVFMKDTQMYKVWESSHRKGITSSGSNNGNENQLQPIDHLSVNTMNDTASYQFILDNHDSKSPYYRGLSGNHYDLTESDVKLVSFYLPQFHPIMENDKWWGKGFTEWTNVSKAVPQFQGHYQPHFPGELGFYDLRVPEVMERQVELAKMYGIRGFCFYYYWFNGRRILEKPLDQLIQSDIDFPFCLCWANENWTRTWDGEEKEILLEQNYGEESLEQFITDLEPYLKDRRYLRVENKPLVIIYRPALIPNLKKTVAKWREYCKANGIGDIYILGVYVKSWGFSDYKKFGLDGMVEFPPHSTYESGASLMNDRVVKLNNDFHGMVFDYQDYVESKKYSVNNNLEGLHRGISPSWDNTARRGANATVYYGSTPALYKKWLSDLIHYTKNSFTKEKQIVFINAWNEWAEGAHLEPDRKFGYAYLEATREALIEASLEKNKKIVYVTHDTHFNGAQLLSLNIIKVLKHHFGYDIEIISKADGVLAEEFEKYGNVFTVANNSRHNFEVYVNQLVNEDYQIAICNSVVSGDIAEVLSKQGMKVISLVHELPGIIKQYHAEGFAQSVVHYANKVVFPSQYVYDQFQSVVNVPSDKMVIQPQGLYKTNSLKGKLNEAKIRLREELSLPSHSKIVLGVGFADLRKGIDIFAEVASLVRKFNNNIYFVWVGSREPGAMDSINSTDKGNVIFIDATPHVDIYYAGSDLYLLTSREDPFPSVVMEALDVETPVIGFKGAGGFADIVTDETGQLVKYLNTTEMVEAVIQHLGNEELLRQKGTAGRSLVEQKFYFVDYVYKLLELLGHEYKKVTAVIPNFNYAHYLEGRISSVINQTNPVYELVYLDDQSKDQSQEVFNGMIAEIEQKYIKVRQIVNAQNSGSVFKQWLKGIRNATGDYIWIAEADDLCSPYFLEKVMKPIALDREVVLSYSQSKQMDQDGNIISNDYLDYTKEIDSIKWNQSYIIDGKTEISEALLVKNTIPNVSGAVFKKFDISEIENEITLYKIAGDWYFYVWQLQKGKLAFHQHSLNYHRRHTNSVTKSENNMLHYREVVQMQDYIIKRFDVSQTNKVKVDQYREFLRGYLGVHPMPVLTSPVEVVTRELSTVNFENTKNTQQVRYIQCGAEYRIHRTDDIYEKFVATGSNTGNLYIGYAVHKFFNTREKFNMWLPLTDQEIEEIRDKADVILMGSSNFINPESDFGVTAENLKKLKLPVIVLGIGAQASDVSVKDMQLTEGTKHFLHQISELSVTIGVRGEFTAEVLNGMGIKNTTVIGCPTYYLNKNPNYRVEKQNELLRSAFNYTDLKQKCDEYIFRHAYANQIDVIGQTEFIEDYWKKDMIINPNNTLVKADEEMREKLYKQITGNSIVEIKKYFRNHFHQYYDIDEWADNITKYNFAIGTRFHGNMIAVQNGVPALLVAHDSRTKELADYCNIPYIEANRIDRKFDLSMLYKETDYSKFNKEYSSKFNKYIDFLRSNHSTDVDNLIKG